MAAVKVAAAAKAKAKKAAAVARANAEKVDLLLLFPHIGYLLIPRFTVFNIYKQHRPQFSVFDCSTYFIALFILVETNHLNITYNIAAGTHPKPRVDGACWLCGR